MRWFRYDYLRATTSRQSHGSRLGSPSEAHSRARALPTLGAGLGAIRKQHPQQFCSSIGTSRGVRKDDVPLRLLNKSLYETSQKCHRLGWYARRKLLPSDNADSPIVNPTREFLIREGLWFEGYVFAHKYGYHHQQPRSSSHESYEVPGSPPPPPPPTPGNRLAFVDEKSTKLAAETTQHLMNDDQIDTLLQPTFLSGNLVARADVALRNRPGTDDDKVSWEIVEIKSSTEKSYRKKVPDLAFTVFVARSAGYTIHKASLVVVDPSYVHNTSDPEQNNNDKETLYKSIDCTKLVDSYIRDHELEQQTVAIDAITGGVGSCDDEKLVPLPMEEYKMACGKCELLGVECGPRSGVDETNNDDRHSGNDTIMRLEHGIWELPRLSQKQFPDVLAKALPTLELRDLDPFCDEGQNDSSGSLLTPNQLRFWKAVATGSVLVDRVDLQQRLQDISDRGPVARYLDFEAVSVLRPPHPGMAPYESMVTQYSLHRRQRPFDGLSHSEFLSDPQRDCRKELLEKLLEDLGYHHGSDETTVDGGDGPILVYSSYEKTQLKRLACLFPEHAETIADVIDQLVDLEKIVRECVSHPDFCGRSSIKTTLPALVPGFQSAYQRLLSENNNACGIAEGGAASAAFAEMISGFRSEPETVERTKRALLEYCKLDTLALVEIHMALLKLIDDE